MNITIGNTSEWETELGNKKIKGIDYTLGNWDTIALRPLEETT